MILRTLYNIFSKVVNNTSLSGVINGCGPHPVTQTDLTKEIARAYKRPLFMPNVPVFALKLILGEMAELVVSGCRAIPQKMRDENFEFKYPDCE